MPDVTPYHYPPVLKELTQALEDVLHASDWHEGVVGKVGFTDADRRRAELGNLTAARSRVRGAFAALDARIEDLGISVRLQEHDDITKVAPEIARAITDAPTDHLPPELRP